MIIEQLPSLVSNAGTSLARANVTVLNGSDGLAQVAAGLVTQALAIYNEARAGLVTNGNQVSRGNGGQPSQAETVTHAAPTAPTEPTERTHQEGD